VAVAVGVGVGAGGVGAAPVGDGAGAGTVVEVGFGGSGAGTTAAAVAAPAVFVGAGGGTTTGAAGDLGAACAVGSATLSIGATVFVPMGDPVAGAGIAAETGAEPAGAGSDTALAGAADSDAPRDRTA